MNGEIRPLDERSSLVDALRTTGRVQWRFGVYTPEPQVDAVDAAVGRVLGPEGGAERGERPR